MHSGVRTPGGKGGFRGSPPENKKKSVYLVVNLGVHLRGRGVSGGLPLRIRKNRCIWECIWKAIECIWEYIWECIWKAIECIWEYNWECIWKCIWEEGGSPPENKKKSVYLGVYLAIECIWEYIWECI